MEYSVCIKGLSKDFGRVHALKNVTFSIPQGSLFGLLGPNGAGKTTLFSIAAGFLKATTGTIHVLDVDVRHISHLRGRFTLLPQDAAFQPGIPVIEQLIMFARLNGYEQADAQKKALDALELVGLGEVAKRSARTLSHGMSKRVALCQAFIGEPEVVFLDEPTSGLDPENARLVRNVIRDLREKKTVVLSSHNLAEIQELCDHVAILNLGELAVCSSMAELTDRSQIIRVTLAASLSDSVEQALIRLPVIRQIERIRDQEFNLHFQLSSPDQKDAAVQEVLQVLASNKLTPRSFQEGASLEAKFLEITGGKFDGASST